MEGLGRGCLCVWEQQGYSKQGYNDIGCSFKLSMLSEIQVRDFISQKGWAIPVTGVSNGLPGGGEPAASDLWRTLVMGWGGHLLERLQISSICAMIASVDVCFMSKDS